MFWEAEVIIDVAGSMQPSFVVVDSQCLRQPAHQTRYRQGFWYQGCAGKYHQLVLVNTAVLANVHFFVPYHYIPSTNRYYQPWRNSEH